MKKTTITLLAGMMALTILPACWKFGKDETEKKEEAKTTQEAKKIIDEIVKEKNLKKTIKEDMKEPEKKINKTPVKSTDSGLKYQVLKTANNDASKPQKGKKVAIHYTGWLSENGKPGAKFDSSIDRGSSFAFIVGIGQVIKGFDEGILMMKVGEKARITIPSNLAYGNRQVGNLIPANSELIFDIELIEAA